MKFKKGDRITTSIGGISGNYAVVVWVSRLRRRYKLKWEDTHATQEYSAKSVDEQCYLAKKANTWKGATR